MDELPELVHEAIEHEGKTYWAVPDYDPDIYENACYGCKFKNMSLRDCQSAIGHPTTDTSGYDTWCAANHRRESVIWINKKYYSKYVKRRTIDRMEKR